MSSDEQGGPDSLGPARPILATALRLAALASGHGDHEGGHALAACAARLARKVRGLGEVADFRLERALDAAEAEAAPAAQLASLREGLEALLGDTDEDEPDVGEPLARAQSLIEQAISIGAPAYNTGDLRGCYGVYSCTARAILAILPGLPEPAAARLRGALEACRRMTDPDEQAWAMRHAFDAVAGLGGTAEGVAPARARDTLAVAISIGAPAFNLGDHRGCYEVYACTARLLVNSPSMPADVRDPLRHALERASTEPNVTRQAWIMREAFDALLGDAVEDEDVWEDEDEGDEDD